MNKRDDRRPQHPSGRPLHDPPYRRLSITRSPGEGPLLPRLRPGALKDAIGFTAHLDRDDDEE